jgi:hypothetical protein
MSYTTTMYHPMWHPFYESSCNSPILSHLRNMPRGHRKVAPTRRVAGQVGFVPTCLQTSKMPWEANCEEHSSTANRLLFLAAMGDDLLDDYVLVPRFDFSGENNESGQTEPRFLGEISHCLDRLAPELWPLNKKIHDNPELGFHEFIAHRALTKFFKKREGWKVTPSAYGLETAWVAVFEGAKKGPVVSFNVEMGECFGKCRLWTSSSNEDFRCP